MLQKCTFWYSVQLNISDLVWHRNTCILVEFHLVQRCSGDQDLVFTFNNPALKSAVLPSSPVPPALDWLTGTTATVWCQCGFLQSSLLSFDMGGGGRGRDILLQTRGWGTLPPWTPSPRFRRPLTDWLELLLLFGVNVDLYDQVSWVSILELTHPVQMSVC